MDKLKAAFVNLFNVILEETTLFKHLKQAWKQDPSISEYLFEQYDERSHLTLVQFFKGIDKHWDDYTNQDESDREHIYWIASHLDDLDVGWRE